MNENTDFSKAIEKVQQMLSDSDGQNQIQNILNMFTNESPQSDQENAPCTLPVPALPSASFDPSDLAMLLKIKNILSAANCTENKQAEFLRSLKPFLKAERRTKLEQAIKFMSAAQIFKAFKDLNEGGD